jgi:hypothetical protein
MTPIEIIQAANGDGVLVYLSDTGTIKATGEQEAIDRWRDILRENKAEIVQHLAGRVDPAPTLPPWCRAGCPHREMIEGVGVGCVRVLTDGPWQEEWRRLDAMAACPLMTQ